VVHLQRITQEQMRESGLEGVGNSPFDEMALIKRFEPFIRRKAGVPAGWALVLLEPFNGDGGGVTPFGCVPGRPLVGVPCSQR
jgi:hypothetical protein